MYPINEIFYSLQGEGFWAGRPAVFIRFSGCNLQCPFCDTDHSHFTRQSLDDILQVINIYPTDLIVLTGGEPSLFVDKPLIDALHQAGKYLAIETNGTHPIAEGIDWITLSPKDSFVANGQVIIEKADEVKLIFDGNNQLAFEKYSAFNSCYFYLQPCDTGSAENNRILTKQSIDYCLQNPQWSLSLQQHKLLDIR